jgi:RNA polymerase sigma-70 factor (ECF subfamily)
MLNSRSEAEDVVQDVFLECWKNRNRINIEGNVKAYLLGAVKRKCQKKFRHMKVVRNHQDYFKHKASNVTTPLDYLEESELNSRISKILQDLPELTRRIFVMNRLDKKKYKLIATELNISIKTVEVHMSKVLKILRSRLKHHLVTLILLTWL